MAANDERGMGPNRDVQDNYWEGENRQLKTVSIGLLTRVYE